MFEFIYKNLINTTTQISVASSTDSASFLFGWDKTYQYVTDGYNDDSTTADIVISFTATTTVDRIALLQHNLKNYSIFYNGDSANVFALSNANTSALSYLNNDQDHQFFRCTPVNCTSVTLRMNSTIQADNEKAVGFFMVSENLIEFARNPAAKNYKIEWASKEVVHRMSDGGTRIHNMAKKWNADIRFQNITQAFRDDLKATWDLDDSFIFCPFGTATGWDEIIFEGVWPGAFKFYEYSDDYVEAGFSGSISIDEVS